MAPESRPSRSRDRDDEPETEAERGVREKRERVPVADRSLQPGDAAGIVRAERRDRLAEQRPDEDGAEADREKERERPNRACRAGGGREADDAEREQDDALGESVPRAVAGDRPPDREAGPGDERDRATLRRRRPARSRRGSATDAPRPRRRARPQRRRRRRFRATPSRPSRRRRRRRRPSPRARRPPPERPRRGLTASRVGPRPWRATVPPGSPVPLPRRLTIRLPCTHHRLNGSRETCHTPRHTPCRPRARASISHLSSHPAARRRADRAGDPRGRRDRHRGCCDRRNGAGDEVVRRAGDRRLVRRRSRRQDLPARVLPRGDQEPPAGRRRLLEREGGDRPRARVREAGEARPGWRGSDASGDRRPTDTASTGNEQERRRARPTRARRRVPTRRSDTMPSRRRPTRPGRRRCRSRCSCSAGSPSCSSPPAPPATSAAA